MPRREDVGAAPPLPDDPGQEDGNGREEEQLGAVQAGPDGLLAAGELDAEPEDAVCREVDDEGLAGRLHPMPKDSPKDDEGDGVKGDLIGVGRVQRRSGDPAEPGCCRVVQDGSEAQRVG